MPTTITELPPELLQHIFLCYVENWHENFLESQAEDAIWHTNLMTVCQSWRKSTLVCSALWAYIPLPISLARLNAHIQRSATHPLKIFTTMVGRWYPKIFSLAIVDLLGMCFDRLDSLVVRAEHENLRLLLEPQFFFPRLKSLVLDAGFASRVLHENDLLATSFISSCCPNITHLRIRWRSTLPNIEFPVGLRSLDLDASQAGISKFRLKCLEPLHRLAHLTLNRSYISDIWIHSPRDSEEMEADSALVDLPSLETLRLEEGLLTSISRMLQNLHIPRLLSLSIVNGYLLDHSGDVGEEIDGICETFSWMSQTIDRATDTLTLSFEGDISLDWRRAFPDESEPSTIHFSWFSVQTYLDPEGNDDWCISVFVRICQALKSESLRRVEVKFSNPIVMTLLDWRNVFASLLSIPNLEVFQVEKVSWTPLFMAAWQSIDEDEEGWVAGQILYPALKCIILKEFEFDDVRFKGTKPGARQLLKMLTRRKELGVKVNELVLERCRGLSIVDYRDMKDLVGNLRVSEGGVCEKNEAQPEKKRRRRKKVAQPCNRIE